MFPILSDVYFLAATVLHGDKTVGGERKQSEGRHEDDGTQRHDLLRGMGNIPGVFGGTDVAVTNGHSVGASFQAVQSSACICDVFLIRHEFVWTFICNHSLATDQEEFCYSRIVNTSHVILRGFCFFRLWKLHLNKIHRFSNSKLCYGLRSATSVQL